MAKLKGTGKEYLQAKKTIGHKFDAEKKIDGAYLDAIDVMITTMNDTKISASIRISISKFIIEAHDKITKTHGKNPQPKDFVVDKVVDEIVEEKSDNVIRMTM